MSLSASLHFVGEGSPLFAFVAAQGIPQAIKRRFRRVTRSGVRGVAYWEMAPQAKPFVLTTDVDVRLFSEAQGLGAEYESRVGSVFDFYWQAAFYGRVIVLDCTVKPVRRLSGTAGGLVAGSALLSADWQLEVLA